MKRIISLILVYTILLCSCGRRGQGISVLDAGSGGAAGGAATGSVSSDSAVTGSAVSGGAVGEETEEEEGKKSELLITMAKKNKPMLSKKVDLTKKSIEVFTPLFATGMTKGDDGNIYYFRYREEGKNKKLIFYMNDGIKVCEAVIPKKYAKKALYSFVEYDGTFWVKFSGDETYFLPLQIKDGRWGKEVAVGDRHVRFFLYEDSFYCIDLFEEEGKIDVIDGNRNRRSFTLAKEGVPAVPQVIVDDKLYYIEGKKRERVMRCNLDGSGKEELFRYSGRDYADEHYCSLTLDGDYLYLHRPYWDDVLTRIPLYGGASRDIVPTAWYDLSGDSIFYVDRTGKICRIRKDLSGEPEVVAEIPVRPYGEIPFLYADGHLLVEGYNARERKMIDIIFAWMIDMVEPFEEIGKKYANERNWVTEDGKKEKTIPGSGLEEKFIDIYENALEQLEEGEYEEPNWYTSKE